MGFFTNIKRGITGVTLALGLIIVLQGATIWVLLGTGFWLEAQLSSERNDATTGGDQLAEIRSLAEEILNEAQTASSEAARAANSADQAASDAQMLQLGVRCRGI
ncbi:hypothetical protein U91I_02794 [alpha proteobacterium U9-1i]|nr:hypothetical protein U91I_02794 [alpha proteobacterium U9-1i]